MNVAYFEGLGNMEAGEELNPLAYNPDDYPEMSDMLEFVIKNQHKAPAKISLRKLSVNGTVRRENMKRYLGAKAASSSGLKEVLKSPAHYYFYANDKANFEEKKKACFELGTFAHLAFLEPELFKKCIVEPKYSLASTAGVLTGIRFYEKLKRLGKRQKRDISDYKLNDLKIYLEELKDGCGFTIVNKKDKLIIECIEKNYYRYGGGIIPMLMKGAVNEASVYYTDPDTGIEVKVRPDSLNFKENIGVDAVISFKTTSAATVGKFFYDSAKFQYELSEGMYGDVISGVTGRKFNATITVMLQTVAPYLPAVFWWTPEDLQNGKYKYHFALDTVRDCNETKLWPGFEALAESGNYGLIEMRQPEWSRKLLAAVDVEN